VAGSSTAHSLRSYILSCRSYSHVTARVAGAQPSNLSFTKQHFSYTLWINPSTVQRRVIDRKVRFGVISYVDSWIVPPGDYLGNFLVRVLGLCSNFLINFSQLIFQDFQILIKPTRALVELPRTSCLVSALVSAPCHRSLIGTSP
jgi:hypothetical protein